MGLGKGSLKDVGSFSIRYTLPYWWLKVCSRASMGEVSEKAQARLSMLEAYKILRNVSVVCKMFNVSRKTFYKWKRRFEESGREVKSLEDLSRSPRRKRKKKLDFKTEIRIKRLRERYIRLGKVKLQKLFEREYGYYVSQNHISYVIKKYNLYYDPLKVKRIRTKRVKNKKRKKVKITEVDIRECVKEDKPFFFCIDTIVMYLPFGIKRYIITAVEYERKIAYARCYRTKSSLSAFDFLLRLFMLVNGKISAVLTDNGSEFSKYFDKACKRLKITHIYTRVRSPKDNCVNERFNRTLKEEFIQTDEEFEVYLAENDLTKANQKLTEYLIFYNLERPHQALNYMSPIQWYNQNHKLMSLLPMYPTYT